MFRLLLVIVTIGLWWGGGQSLFTSLGNLDQEAVSCSDYLNGVSDHAWVDISGCYSANGLVLAVVDQNSKSIKSSDKFYLPLYGSQQELSKATEDFSNTADLANWSFPTKAYLKITRASEIAKLINLLNMDQSGVEKLASENPEMLAFILQEGAVPVAGLRMFGIEADDSSRKVLAGHAGNDDFIIIEQGGEPESIFLGLFMLGLAFLASLLTLRLFVGRKR